jgi:hypothetical protein
MGLCRISARLVGAGPRLTGADQTTPDAGGCSGGCPKVLPNWATRADTRFAT